MLNDTPNRIQAAIDRMEAVLQKCRETGKKVNGEPFDEVVFNANNDFDLIEYVTLQERKSLAVAMGTLTADEGQLVYNLMGNTPDQLNKQSTAVKVVLTMLLGQLLEQQSGRKVAK